MTGKRGTAEDRFWRFVEKTDDGCWRWTGSLDHGGYSRFNIRHGEQVSAYRFSYEQLVGPIPDGLHLDHVAERGCRHRDCVNPAHLEPVTQAENNRRTGARKTHCKRGHERTPENTATRRDGSHYCKACRRVTS